MDEALFNELLECSVCLEQLDSTSKVLPCQHTFCKRCLEEIVNSHKELRCPECRVLVECEIDQLPTNILLIRLLEGIKNNPRIKQTGSNVKKAESHAKVPSGNPVPNKASQSHEIRQNMPTGVERKAVLKQPLHPPPCAKAMYSYEGKEHGDLSFKKGDVIILQRRIDQNWYHGEVNGKFGFVPARYVRVLVPIPTHIPQCKALYDFSVAEKDEKDCLTFKKGDIITVIRRVDDNWSEGKLGDKIGIFPISFVEMNVAARSLMKLSVNSQQGPSRVAPPTPATNSSLVAQQSTSKPTSDNSSKVVLHMLDSSATTTPSPSSSTTPSPNTPPSSSNSSSSLPRPQRVPPSVPEPAEKPYVVLCRSSSQRHSHHQKEKRHSLSSISSASGQQKSPQIPVAHKHSLEILSTAGGDVLAAPTRAVGAPTSATSTANSFFPSNARKNCLKDDSNRRHPHNCDVSKIVTGVTTTITTTAPTIPNAWPASAVSSDSNHIPSIPPVNYIALYNYRPQKEDELELKKGEFYTVTEKCQDGWFKGTSLRTSHSGVFPGNYVQIAKSASQFHQGSSNVANVRTMSGPKSMLPVANVPPRLKPAAILPQQLGIQPGTLPLGTDKNVVASAVYVRAKSSGTETRTSVTAGLLDWAHSVTSNASSMVQHYQPSDNNEPMGKNTPKSAHLPKTTAAAATTVPDNSSVFQIATSMAASYPSTSSQHPPTSANSSPATPGNIIQSWQAFPATPFVTYYATSTTSMSIVTPPNVSLKPSMSTPHSKSEKHKMRKDKTRDSLMKRFTSKKKTRLPVANFSCDNPTFVDSSVPLHSSENLQARAESGSSDAAYKPNSIQTKPIPEESAFSETPKTNLKQPALVRERFRCVVPYPPNSEYELELKVGDIVYVHKKRDDGWYKGTLMRTGKTGLFPASFVNSY